MDTKISTSSEEMEGAPLVAGMSPLSVSKGKPVPMGGQKQIKQCWQYPHDSAREQVVLGRVTLSSCSCCPTHSSRFCFSSRCTVLPCWTSTKETRCPQINVERRCCTLTACQFPPCLDPRQLVVVLGAILDQVVHEAMPLGLPDR